MITDPVPRSRERKAGYLKSDALRRIPLPAAEELHPRAREIERALLAGDREGAEAASAALLAAAAPFYEVPIPAVEVLSIRPHRVAYGVCVYEKFGDYTPKTQRIRLWMRTAIQHKVTAFGVFLSTLCHELCHHLDARRFGIAASPHTRAFYERAGLLYHQAAGTPVKPLYWIPLRGGRWRVDWQRLR